MGAVGEDKVGDDGDSEEEDGDGEREDGDHEGKDEEEGLQHEGLPTI